MRFIRSSSSVHSRTTSARSAGSSPISSRWPRTIVMGVRSSCEASSTNWRCVPNACSSRSSIELNWPVSAAMSSRPCTGIRWVRSRSVSSAAARRTKRTGARICPATSHAAIAASTMPTPLTGTSVRIVWSTSTRSRSTK